MARKKIRVGVLFGGKSAEHEVSIQSARSVIAALDEEKYDIIPIGITRAGKWILGDTAGHLLRNGDSKLVGLADAGTEVALAIHSPGTLADVRGSSPRGKLDVVFPVLHGPYGEDGSIQGFLKLAGVPFVGAGVLGSAVGMDKDVAKRLLREAGMPVAKFAVFRAGVRPSFAATRAALGSPVFVKPANLGSSVGVAKVRTAAEFSDALTDAFRYDSRVLVEEAIPGREIECSVLGNENPVASVPGEVIPRHEFYSYEAKYIDENGAALEIPARIPTATAEKIRTMAVTAFTTLGCEGMGRVDFFLKRNGDIVVNEINTIPGFTAISMYPKLWEASGVPFPKLLDRLIELAVERFERDRKLRSAR